MSLFVLILPIVTFVIRSEAISINVSLIKDYLKLNNIKTCVLMNCLNIPNRARDNYHFHTDDIWTNNIDISDGNVQINYTSLVRLVSLMSVAIDLECLQSMVVLNEISVRKMFHFERFWIMFSNDLDEAYKMLKNQNINIDAEIMLVTPTKLKYLRIVYLQTFIEDFKQYLCSQYAVFDVFNPSFKRGGKLNITRIGYWSIDMGFDIYFRQKKYERRNLVGLTLHSSMTVT